MRIELNAGGLCGIASISSMQTDINSLLSKSSSLMVSFQRVRNFAYNMNGGVGSLGSAVDQIERRISHEESCITALKAVEKKSNGFIELAIGTDIKVGGLVNKSKNEFYRVNSWAKPPQIDSAKKSFGEKAWEWLCGVGDAVAETVQKVRNGIRSFYSSAKDKMDEIFAGFQEWWKDHMTITPTVVEDDVFNSEKAGFSNGYYGADQGRPTNNVLIDGYLSDDESDYLDIIIANTGKEDFSEDELKLYLDELNSHGCGYAAITNTIMEYYCNRPNGEQEFYEKFGFPIRKADGNLNFDRVIVDLYSKQNGLNHNSVNTESFSTILSQYMGDCGATIKVEKDVKVTATNYDNLVREGKQVVVMGWDFPLYYDETKSKKRVCGGHGMVVTGVTEDGLLIVSTWGGKAYIDPKDNGKLVTKDGNISKTKLTFQTVEFE